MKYKEYKEKLQTVHAVQYWPETLGDVAALAAQSWNFRTLSLSDLPGGYPTVYIHGQPCYPGCLMPGPNTDFGSSVIRLSNSDWLVLEADNTLKSYTDLQFRARYTAEGGN